MLTYRFDHGRRSRHSAPFAAVETTRPRPETPGCRRLLARRERCQRTGRSDRADCAAHQIPLKERDYDAGREEVAVRAVDARGIGDARGAAARRVSPRAPASDDG